MLPGLLNLVFYEIYVKLAKQPLHWQLKRKLHFPAKLIWGWRAINPSNLLWWKLKQKFSLVVLLLIKVMNLWKVSFQKHNNSPGCSSRFVSRNKKESILPKPSYIKLIILKFSLKISQILIFLKYLYLAIFQCKGIYYNNVDTIYFIKVI